MPKAGLISSDLPTVQPDVESIKGLFFFSNSLRNVIYSDVCSTIAGTRVLFGRYDSNGNVIELALWEDMARNFNKKESDSTEKTVIIAVTSCRVYSFIQVPQHITISTPIFPTLKSSEPSREGESKTLAYTGPLSKYWVRDEEEDMRDAFNVLIKTGTVLSRWKSLVDEDGDGMVNCKEFKQNNESKVVLQA
ncbi:nucleic acid-binding, OB-fold protein [Tanacetum coccineum]